MGDWGGAPEGWVPPEERKEQAAAAEAAAAMEARRHQADDRSAAVAGAIRDGLGMVAAAIMVASEHPAGYALERFETIWSGLVDPDGSTMEPAADGLDAPYTGPLMSPPNPLLPDADNDRDLDDLLAPDGDGDG